MMPLKGLFTPGVRIVCCLLCLTGLASCAGRENTALTSGGGSTGLFSALVSVYRGPLNHLAAVRHGECPMFPSCSEYARQAVDRHGEIPGWIMACDRLMRCGRDEVSLAPRIQVNGEWRSRDTLSMNDFWWNPSAPVSPQ